MKKILLVVFLLLSLNAIAQVLTPVKRIFNKPKFQVGLGVQYTSPFYSLSFKYAVTKHSVLEAIASPFSSSGNGLSYYGLRYINRIAFINLPFLSSLATSYPYVFVSAGSLSWNYNNGISYSGSTLGYYGGAGYEVILARHFAISAELGFGQLSALKNDAIFDVNYNGGLHYYFGSKNKSGATYEGTTVMGNEQTPANSEGDGDKQDEAAGNEKNDDDMENSDTATEQKQILMPVGKRITTALHGDLGISSIMNTRNNITNTGSGTAWALGEDICIRLTGATKKTKICLLAGIELRNFNASVSSSDGEGGTEYNNLHYWYGGIPITLQLMSNPAKGHILGWYALVGAFTGYQLYMLDVQSIQGTNTWVRTESQHNPVIVQPYISGGITLNSGRRSVLIGPYVSYSANNISKLGGNQEAIAGYGIRLTLASR